MVGSCADGGRCADVVEEAGVHAVVLDAGSVSGAVLVDVAFNSLASDEGVSN